MSYRFVTPCEDKENIELDDEITVRMTCDRANTAEPGSDSCTASDGENAVREW